MSRTTVTIPPWSRAAGGGRPFGVRDHGGRRWWGGVAAPSLARALAAVLLLAAPAGAQVLGVTDAARFGIDWVVERKGDCAWVTGYVQNRRDKAYTNIRLLVEELDAADQVERTTVAILSSDLPGSGRAPFRTPVSGKATGYRVTIRSYDGVRGR
jgi:hypothetical protein